MSKWTLKEKKCLLDTLQKEGSKNIAALKRKLPRKTAEEIEAMCSKYEQLAQKRIENRKKENAPIDTWIEIFRNISNERPDYVDITARVIKYLGLFGTDYTTECDDPMLKKCYIWLAQAAKGREPDPIDECSSWLLEQCLMHLMRATRVSNNDAEQYIRSVETVPTQGLFNESSSINPLDIPAQYLKIEKWENKDPFDQKYDGK